MPSSPWSTFYSASDSAHTSTAGFTDDAQRVLEEKWRGFFAGLADGANVLDVATGNGALLDLARQTTDENHRLRMTGVDLADVEGSELQSTEHFDASLIGAVDMLSLPYENGSFDAVCSQFGLEYGGLESAIQEAARICRGQLAAVVHASDGAVVRQNAPVADQIDWLLDDLRLVELLNAYLLSGNRSDGERVKALAVPIKDRIATTENPSFLISLAQSLGVFLSSRPGPAEVAELGRFESALRNYQSRMSALGQAACAESEIDRAVEVLGEAGFQGRWYELRSDGSRHLIGYWLEGECVS